VTSLPPSDLEKKERLDLALIRRALARTRGEAQEWIRKGYITVAGRKAQKAGQLVLQTDPIEVDAFPCRYVSRGGLKLEAALESFAIDVSGKKCLDIGASTGGFTDCLLQRGAAGVTAVDVGHSQMDPRILSDPRVRNFEGINARSLRPEEIGEIGEAVFEIIVADLSFISLTLVLPALVPLLAPGGTFILLVKPQFEVGREGLGKRGIVTDSARREEAVAKVCQSAIDLGLVALDTRESPVQGGDGNREYLAAFTKRKKSLP